jgi:hypothetical protein
MFNALNLADTVIGVQDGTVLQYYTQPAQKTLVRYMRHEGLYFLLCL